MEAEIRRDAGTQATLNRLNPAPITENNLATHLHLGLI